MAEALACKLTIFWWFSKIYIYTWILWGYVTSHMIIYACLKVRYNCITPKWRFMAMWCCRDSIRGMQMFARQASRDSEQQPEWISVAKHPDWYLDILMRPAYLSSIVRPALSLMSPCLRSEYQEIDNNAQDDWAADFWENLWRAILVSPCNINHVFPILLILFRYILNILWCLLISIYQSI